MNRYRAGVGLVALLIALAAAQASAQATGPEALITQRTIDYMTAWNAHDLDRLMKLFEAKGWFVNGSTVMGSTDSLRAYFQNMMEPRTSDQFKWDRSKIVMLGNDAALFQGVYGGTVAFKDGRVVQWKSNAMTTFLFERRGQDWKIVAFHGSAGGSVAVPK